MSGAIQCYDCPTIYAGSVGFSKDSTSLAEKLEKEIRSRWEDVSMGYPLEETKEAVIRLFTESSQPDWDGYGASPVTSGALAEALKLIELLPRASVPMPEVSAHPNGEIGLEWRTARRMVFIVSVGGKQKINYAGLFGDEKINGSAYFGESLPSRVIENLRGLYRQ